jgi:hypothetical protein
VNPPAPGHGSLREMSTETLDALVNADSAATDAVGGTVSAHGTPSRIRLAGDYRLQSGDFAAGQGLMRYSTNIPGVGGAGRVGAP